MKWKLVFRLEFHDIDGNAEVWNAIRTVKFIDYLLAIPYVVDDYWFDSPNMNAFVRFDVESQSRLGAGRQLNDIFRTICATGDSAWDVHFFDPELVEAAV